VEVAHIRIRANRHTGELEVEGPIDAVADWWDRVWPELADTPQQTKNSSAAAVPAEVTSDDVHQEFGEFLNGFRSDATSVDHVLIAGAYVQARESDRTFTTKTVNQLLIDQHVKVTNPSECVRRLTQSKRAFVVSEGRFRVSKSGFDHITSLKTNG
jgi:hypothetical protein